jgi:hypothetical protein
VQGKKVAFAEIRSDRSNHTGRTTDPRSSTIDRREAASTYSQRCIALASCKKPASYATCRPKVGYPGDVVSGGACTRTGSITIDTIASQANKNFREDMS